MNCYILCGGKSSRMGRPKQELEIGGRTFLEAVHGEAASVFDQVVAVAKAGRDQPGLPTIHEAETDLTAPILGLARAAEHAGDTPFFALAVDYPLMAAPLLRFLRERSEASGAEIVAPRTGEKIHVLCAAYRPAIKATLDEKIGRGDFRLQGLIDLHSAEVIEASELTRFGESALLNVNTKEDYELAKGIHGETIKA